MNKTLLVLIPILLAIAGFNNMNQNESVEAVPLQVANLHSSWMVNYNKVYSSPEELNHRLGLFHESYELVMNHNANPDATYTMELNQFADMDNQEIRAKFLMGDLDEENHEYIESERRLTAEEAPEPINSTDGGLLGAPSSVDWRKLGYVPPVLNQKSCGSCWAFSAAAMAEVTWNVKNKKVEQFSPQQVLDCSGAGSCAGGWPYKTVGMFQRTGAALHSDYPYKSVQGRCDSSKIRNPRSLAGTKSGYIAKTEATFESWNAARVLSVIIAVNKNFMLYKNGVFNDNTCESARTGLHAITLNGYSRSGRYWILRNSWGSGWGESGYFRLGKGSYGVCGLYKYGFQIN